SAFVSEALNVLKFKLAPQSLIEMCYRSLFRAVQICRVEIIQMRKIVDHVNHAPRTVVDVKVAHGSWARGNLLECFRRNVNAEDMIFTFNARLKIDCSTMFRPS